MSLVRRPSEYTSVRFVPQQHPTKALLGIRIAKQKLETQKSLRTLRKKASTPVLTASRTDKATQNTRQPPNPQIFTPALLRELRALRELCALCALYVPSSLTPCGFLVATQSGDDRSSLSSSICSLSSISVTTAVSLIVSARPATARLSSTPPATIPAGSTSSINELIR